MSKSKIVQIALAVLAFLVGFLFSDEIFGMLGYTQ